jgi:hypothetical protein
MTRREAGHSVSTRFKKQERMEVYRMTHDEDRDSRLTDEYMDEIRKNKNRNQSGLSSQELNQMRMEFTPNYIDKIRLELDKLMTAYQSLNQEGIQTGVDAILRESMIFRAVINYHSEEDGVYRLTTDDHTG